MRIITDSLKHLQKSIVQIRNDNLPQSNQLQQKPGVLQLHVIDASS